MYDEFMILPSDDIIGAEIRGVDLSVPLEPDVFAEIEAAFNYYAVVCFRDQTALDQAGFIEFAKRFGEVKNLYLPHYAHPAHPEIVRISNIQEDGTPIGHANAGNIWHSDMSYTAEPPRATLLHAIEIPKADGVALGATRFASAVAAHDALPQATKDRIEGLMAVHNVYGRRGNKTDDPRNQAIRKQQPDVVHPLVRIHPLTGRKALCVAKGECTAIEGMAEEEALALIEELADAIPRQANRHTHEWRAGDVVIWDNCAVQHIATFNYEWPRHRRLIHRITVGGGPTH